MNILSSGVEGNSALISRLQSNLYEQISLVAPRAAHYALLDFPNYSNVGDSAIYLGVLKLFKSLYGRGPDFVMELDPADLDHLVGGTSDDLIFLQGGGNFGDLWPRHQLFRETVLKKFLDRKIIQLPQTIHFASNDALTRCARIINAHRDFTLLVRDHRSYAIAREAFTCAVHLCPDSAFMLGHQVPRTTPSFDTLFLLRGDKEASTDGIERLKASGARVEDWLVEPQVKTFRQRAGRRIAKHSTLLGRMLEGRRSEAFKVWAEKRTERGLKQLSSAKLVVTDRLHAHILSLLLGKPHILLDNSYGKVSSFADAWTQGGCYLRAETLDEACDLAAKFHSGSIAPPLKGWSAHPGVEP